MALTCGNAVAEEKAQRSEETQTFGDHELMTRVATGDKTAFALLCGRHMKGIVAVAERILGNEAEADEVAQEAFLRLWQRAPQWDPNGAGTVRTWVSRVATNLCLDMLRRRRSVPLENEEAIEDVSQGPWERLRQEDRRRMVQTLLLKLPERQRAAIVFSYFEELSGQSIADIMGISVGAVESLLVRGREGLRKQMKLLGLTWGEDL